MQPIQTNYPIFEANQVLMNTHLNQVFNYLDEQERLTRANLIGIGIVCGLEIRLDATTQTIHLAKGCGVTSEGYLIVEPNDVALVSYRSYEPPPDLEYPPFKNKTPNPQVPYLLWELFPTGEPKTTSLGADPSFLKDKAVLLFLELKKEGLRNCSPNNCDDKGAEITATVRRLLISVTDLSKIIAEANKLGTGLTFTDLETALLARLNLPDLHLPRYDVPNTGPVTSNAVLAAFHAVFQTDKLVAKLGKALTDTYQAFKPIVEKVYPTNPFAGFIPQFGFLDNAPATTAQVRFLQYYYDFFDDLLRAYDEFRWKGVKLMCVCCPPAGLFPRHLMLGVLFPAAVSNPSLYRHHFLASPALSDCEERRQELEQLFRRLVEMIARFTNVPPLPPPSPNAKTDTQIRITPSQFGAVPLSDKAIPYYYQQNGTPPLFQLWNAEKTRRNRANQNLGYRSDEYTPPAPAFVTNALRYDLESENFLRIEGHLGANYQNALTTLLSLKTRYRLPIEILALRTGVFDEKMPVDLSKEECRFQDLETLYDTTRVEWLCFLVKQLTYLYNLPLKITSPTTSAAKSQFALINNYAPGFLVQPNTLGRKFEDDIASQGGVVPELNAAFSAFLISFWLPPDDNLVSNSFYYFIKLGDTLPDNLTDFRYIDFETRYKNLEIVVKAIEQRREQGTGNLEGTANILNWEEIDDRLEAILNACRLDTFKAIQDEYVNRIREVKQKQFLSHFLQKNPGIQHKAGVPLGGTFILVYHDDPEPVSLAADLNVDAIRADILSTAQTARTRKVDAEAVSQAFARVSANPQFTADANIRFLVGTFTGQIPNLDLALPPVGEADKIIAATVNELADGTVIADFYLPYLCCSDCSPVQFVLPKNPPTFTVQIGCTNANNEAEVTVKPEGGLPPYSLNVDNKGYKLLSTVMLSPGPHTLVIQDAATTKSAPQTITVADRLTLGQPTYKCTDDHKNYTAEFQISGGTLPYRVNDKEVTGAVFTTDPIASGTTASIIVTDKHNCAAKTEVKHTCCDLPCKGISRRCAYRLWLQPPVGEARYEIYRLEGGLKFRFNGQVIDLPEATTLLGAETAQLNQSFDGVMGGIVKKLNSVVNSALNNKFGKLSKPRLLISYEPTPNDPFGILWIEYFVCETFNLEFSFSVAKPAPLFNLMIRYTNEPDAAGLPFNGVILTNRGMQNKETRVPAFDCSERDQCTGGKYQKLCEGPLPKPSLSIKRQGDAGFQFTGSMQTSIPLDVIAAWVWDVPGSQPLEPFYTGQQTNAEFREPSGTARLTVITKTGCFGFADRGLLQ